MPRNRKFALLVWTAVMVAVMALLYWPSEQSQTAGVRQEVSPPRAAVGLKDVFLALMPLAIGFAAIGLLRGWVTLRDKHTREPIRIAGLFRACVLGCAILATFAGVAFLLQLTGVLDAALRR
jgi:hypothetical protein